MAMYLWIVRAALFSPPSCARSGTMLIVEAPRSSQHRLAARYSGAESLPRCYIAVHIRLLSGVSAATPSLFGERPRQNCTQVRLLSQFPHGSRRSLVNQLSAASPPEARDEIASLHLMDMLRLCHDDRDTETLVPLYDEATVNHVWKISQEEWSCV